MPSILSLLSPRGLLEGGSSSRSRSPWDQLAAAAAAADFYQLKQHSSSSSQPTWPRQAAAPTNDGKPGSLGISPLGAQIIITQVVMSILAVAWTGMRVWARRNRRISPFVVEDVLCYVALALHLVLAVLLIAMAVVGSAGHHVATMTLDQYVVFAKLTFAAQFFYAAVVGLVKLSMTWNMKRIFSVPGFEVAAYAVMACSVAWVLQTMLVPLLICTPISYQWDPANASVKCGNAMLAYTFISVVDIITDFMVLVLPLRPLAKLQIQRPYKIALLAVFGSVLICMVLTAIRIYAVYNIDYNDLPYASAVPTIISSIQTGLAIMIASSPLLRPVFDRTIGSWLGLSLRTRTNRTGTTNMGTDTRGKITTNRSKVTSVRRPSRCFEQINDSDPNLDWELHAVKDPRVFTAETTCTAHTRKGSQGGGPPNGILVTESTVVARAL